MNLKNDFYSHSDIFVSGPEWCGCFSKAERPCAAVRRRSSPEVAPSCDSRGYYQSTQCHRGLGLCWCVDQHGIEFAGTRVRDSKPDCGQYATPELSLFSKALGSKMQRASRNFQVIPLIFKARKTVFKLFEFENSASEFTRIYS